MHENYNTHAHIGQRLIDIGFFKEGLSVKYCGEPMKLRGRWVKRLCRNRLCPNCGPLTVKKQKTKAPSKMGVVLLTMTVCNCPWGELSSVLQEMQKAWRRLLRRLHPGGASWLKVLHISKGKNNLAHPHFHVLIDNCDLRDSQVLCELWQKARNSDKAEVCDLRRNVDTIRTIHYLARSMWVDLDDSDLFDYVCAIQNVRMVDGNRAPKKSKYSSSRQDSQAVR